MHGQRSENSLRVNHRLLEWSDIESQARKVEHKRAVQLHLTSCRVLSLGSSRNGSRNVHVMIRWCHIFRLCSLWALKLRCGNFGATSPTIPSRTGGRYQAHCATNNFCWIRRGRDIRSAPTYQVSSVLVPRSFSSFQLIGRDFRCPELHTIFRCLLHFLISRVLLKVTL